MGFTHRFSLLYGTTSDRYFQASANHMIPELQMRIHSYSGFRDNWKQIYIQIHSLFLLWMIILFLTSADNYHKPLVFKTVKILGLLYRIYSHWINVLFLPIQILCGFMTNDLLIKWRALQRNFVWWDLYLSKSIEHMIRYILMWINVFHFLFFY